MTYKQAYNILNKNGIIDIIINTESQNNEDINNIKVEIINGIEYFLDLIKDSSFKNMKYWWHNPENLRQRVAQKICKELGCYQLKQIEKNKKQYEYMIQSL